ncbi:hypothetical protein [Brevibacillus massiliensis]|jgi:uncharacterized coiled-coil protein SlyX|uniref:hypothetical protein n=1 Tax=Brevibacillus massiliensis TaxID=1118054 RepID=UPI0003197F08|nr:hypothetical protein [Brevibacillus massiliensis]
MGWQMKLCFWLLICIVLVGCGINQGADANQDRDKRLAELEKRLEALETKAAAQEKELAELQAKNGMLAEELNETAEGLTQATHLLRNLPDLSVTLAYIQTIEEESGTHYLIADDAEWLTGEGAVQAIVEDTHVKKEDVSLPNGFYVRNTQSEHRKAALANDALIYLLEGAAHQYTPHADFTQNKNAWKERLFWLYQVGGEVVLVKEQYLP